MTIKRDGERERERERKREREKKRKRECVKENKGWHTDIQRNTKSTKSDIQKVFRKRVRMTERVGEKVRKRERVREKVRKRES